VAGEGMRHDTARQKGTRSGNEQRQKQEKKKYLQVDTLARGQGERGVTWRAVGEGTRNERMGCAQNE
jgi:hypothetical protein